MVIAMLDVEKRVNRARRWVYVMMGLSVINGFFTVLFVMTMYQLGGRFNVLSQLFNTTRGTDTMFYSDALDSSVSNIDTLEWGFVQRYIEEKVFLIPDPKEMLRRWGPYGDLALMSYRTFKPTRSNSDDRLKNLPP